MMHIFLLPALTLLFIILKLTGAVAWPWVVVFSPSILAALMGLFWIIMGILVVNRKL